MTEVATLALAENTPALSKKLPLVEETLFISFFFVFNLFLV